MNKPFSVQRLGQPKGPDTPEHLFCVEAQSNPELVRTHGAGYALISGAGGSDPKMARAAAQRLADALNEQWDKYMNGNFHVEGGAA